MAKGSPKSPSPTRDGNYDKISLDEGQEISIGGLQQDIASLIVLLHSKQQEWNAVLKLLKLKEMRLEQLKRQAEILEASDFKIESEAAMEEMLKEQKLKMGPDGTQAQFNISKIEKEINEMEVQLEKSSNNFSCSNHSTNNATESASKIIEEGTQASADDTDSIPPNDISMNSEESLISDANERSVKSEVLPKPFLKAASDVSYSNLLVTLAQKAFEQDEAKDVATASIISADSNITSHEDQDMNANEQQRISSISAVSTTPNTGVNLINNEALTVTAINNAPTWNTNGKRASTQSESIMKVKGKNGGMRLCQGCYSENAQFYCAGCRNQWYCSRSCQIDSWENHSQQCSGQ